MNQVSAPAFADTVILPEPAAPARGKPLRGGGKNLPQNAPENAPEAAHSARRAVERLGSVLGHVLRFEVDLRGGETVIYVLDRGTGEVIRRIPREEIPELLTASGRFDLRLLNERL